MKVLLATILLCVLIEARNPEWEWIDHEDRQFAFVHRPDTYLKAVTNCEVEGGNMVVINSSAKNDIIANKVLRFSDTYIGLRNAFNEWKWVNGEPVEYTNWNLGEPDGVWTRYTHRCVSMTKWEMGKWKDVGCKGLKYYICERDIRAMPGGAQLSTSVNHYVILLSLLALATRW